MNDLFGGEMGTQNPFCLETKALLPGIQGVAIHVLIHPGRIALEPLIFRSLTIVIRASFLGLKVCLGQTAPEA